MQRRFPPQYLEVMTDTNCFPSTSEMTKQQQCRKQRFFRSERMEEAVSRAYHSHRETIIQRASERIFMRGQGKKKFQYKIFQKPLLGQLYWLMFYFF